MALSDQQIAGAAKNAGFTGSAMATAVAIALAESGGNSDATNVNSNGSTDYGLWQINSVHADLLRAGDWKNPTDNAKMAFKISAGGTSWTPWTVYKSGAYRKFADRAQLAAGAPVDPGPGSGGGGSDPTAGLTFFTNKSMWARVGVFILATALLLFAFWKLTGVGDAVVKVAKGVVGARTGGLVKL